MGVQKKPGASQFEKARGHTHVIRMNVGQKDFVNVVPCRSLSRHRQPQGFETLIGIHATVNQKVTMGQPHQVNIDRTQSERKRQYDEKDSRQYLTVTAFVWRVKPQCQNASTAA